MATPSTEGSGRNRRLVTALFVLSLIVIAAESFLLSQFWVVNQAGKAQSDKLLNSSHTPDH